MRENRLWKADHFKRTANNTDVSQPDGFPSKLKHLGEKANWIKHGSAEFRSITEASTFRGQRDIVVTNSSDT